MLTLLFIKLYSPYQWWIQGRGPPPRPPTYSLTKLRPEGPKKVFFETVPPPPLISRSGSSSAYCLAAFAFKFKLLVHSTYTQLFETPIAITPAPPQYHQTFKLVGKWEVLVGI